MQLISGVHDKMEKCSLNSASFLAGRIRRKFSLQKLTCITICFEEKSLLRKRRWSSDSLNHLYPLPTTSEFQGYSHMTDMQGSPQEEQR